MEVISMISIDETDKINIKNLKYIDLFCGIGGFRQALDSFDAQCVFSSDIDKNACKVYKKNYKDEPKGDIRAIKECDVPHHDILCAGFPCQAFSISGKQRGFEDERGTLFFEIIRIANYHKPKLLLLENVANFARHDGGKTLDIVLSSLKKIGYDVYHKILNASDYSIPQKRMRIYFVCFRSDMKISHFHFPVKEVLRLSLKDIVLQDNETHNYVIKRDDIALTHAKAEPDMFEFVSNNPIRVGTVNKGGQGERIYSENGSAITLSAYGGGVGAKTGLYLINGRVRKLSPRECARLQGFPESFIMDSSSALCYKQFGNSLVIDVVQKILIEINKVI